MPRPTLLFLISIVFLFQSTLIHADDQDAKLTDLYYVHTDDPSTGGCTTEQLDWLNAAYPESIKMVQGALKDIDEFKQPRPIDQGKQINWDKTFLMLAQMFGLRGPDKENGGVRGLEHRAHLNNVRDNLESISKWAKGPIPEDPKQRKAIFCNTNGVALLGPDDIVPDGESQGKKASELNAPDGVYYQATKYDDQGKEVMPGFIMAAVKDQDGKVLSPEEHICPDKCAAITFRGLNRMFVCPWAFDNLIKTAEVGSVVANTPLDVYDCGSHLLVHEFVHLWNPINDVPAVDMTPGLQGQRPKVTNGKKVYSFGQCCDLADYYAGETVSTAETYAMFAAGQYFRDWMWMTGVNTEGNRQRGLAWPMDTPYKPPK